jgi:ABC-2 type transport system ATP-binding protein
VQEQATGVDTMIRITDLVKDYRVGWLQHKKFRALDGVCLDVKAGEIFGFLGPNGAGKTTTIKAMLGITKPTSGSIEMFGCSGVSKGARSHIGYFPEISYYYKYLSAREAVIYYGKLCRLSRKELRKRADWVLEIVGLYEQRNKLLSKFSKGMLQRVGLAQALINDPALLIMDEPTAGLDPLMKKEMRNLILSLNGEGKTVFFSSHELSEVEMICHRVAVLDRGKVIAQGPLSEIVPFEGALTVVASKVPEKVVAKLQELGVSVSRESGNLVIRGIDNKTIYQLLAGLGANGCELVEVRPQKQTLEDFFVNTITQKEMETEE